MSNRRGVPVTLTRAVPSAHLSASWEAPPAVLIGAALALLLFAQAFVRLRRRRAEHAPWTPGRALRGRPRAAGRCRSSLRSTHAGDERLLSAHMLQHVLIGDAAPALLVVAVRGPLLFFLLPPPLLRPLAAFRPLRALLSVLLLPLVSLGLWAVVILVWHVPRVYDYAAAHPLVHDLEHLSFVVDGNPRLDAARRPGPARAPAPPAADRVRARDARARAAGRGRAALQLERRATRATPTQRDRLFGISPLTDQRLAGVVMMVEQLLTLGICVALLLRPYLRCGAARAAAGAAARVAR